jgi:hypothetical protein
MANSTIATVLPLHRFDDRADFRAGKASITGAGDEAGANGAFQDVVGVILKLVNSSPGR